MSNKHISERYEFRNIKQNEAEEAAEIERICFPPNEACSKKHMKDRVAGIADLFLVAIDKENGKMAGFLNGLATDDEILKDEFFTISSSGRQECHASGIGCTAGIPQSGTCKRTGTPVSRKRMGAGKKRDYPYLSGIEGSDV